MKRVGATFGIDFTGVPLPGSLAPSRVVDEELPSFSLLLREPPYPLSVFIFV